MAVAPDIAPNNIFMFEGYLTERTILIDINVRRGPMHGGNEATAQEAEATPIPHRQKLGQNCYTETTTTQPTPPTPPTQPTQHSFSLAVFI